MANRSVARVDLDRADKPIASGANTVFTNFKKTAHEGSITESGNAVVQGDTSVFVEKKSIARAGDQTAKGRAILTGSTNVFAEDNGPADAVLIENDDIEDGTTATEGAAVKHLATNVKKGILDAGTVARTTSAKSIIADDGEGNSIIGPEQDCQMGGITSFPMTLKISNSFTLGNMLQRWIDGQLIQYPNHKLQLNQGFSIAQIVCNLSLLCRNVLDPLLKKYPDFRITNSFRETASGKKYSQHGNGQACDIIFGVRSRPLTYERAQWIRDNLPYDQLILEYRDQLVNGSSNIQNWIHVSFTGNDVYRLTNGSGDKGCRPANASNKIGSMYNDQWKASKLQLY